MSKQRIIDLGAFPAGSIPTGSSFKFYNNDGSSVDMSTGSWTGEAKAEQLHTDTQPADLGSGTVTITTLTSTGSYAWAAADFATVGRFQLVIWVTDGTHRYGSPTLEWEVYDAPGEVPVTAPAE